MADVSKFINDPGQNDVPVNQIFTDVSLLYKIYPMFFILNNFLVGNV